jgi:uncharacterized membrane protein YqhA
METVDICDTDEFKNDPSCKSKKKKRCVTENIFWTIVLVIVMFFSSTWMELVDRVLDKIFGNKRSDLVVVALGLVSLILVLGLAHFFDVDLEY